MARNSDPVTVGTHVKLMSSIQWLWRGASGYKDIARRVRRRPVSDDANIVLHSDHSNGTRGGRSSVLGLPIANAGHTFS
jgi:hypothetical protein